MRFQHFDREHQSGRTKGRQQRKVASSTDHHSGEEPRTPQTGLEKWKSQSGEWRPWRVQVHEKHAIQLELGASDLEASMPLARCSSKEGGIVKEMQSADSEHPFYDPLEEVVGVAEISGVGQALPGTMRGGKSRGNLARGLQFFFYKKKGHGKRKENAPIVCILDGPSLKNPLTLRLINAHEQKPHI